MKVDILGVLRMAQRHLALLDRIKDTQMKSEDLEDQYEVLLAEEILQELIDNIAIVQSDPTQIDEFLRTYCLKKG